MPRPGLPPTPASSTEIRGKDQIEAIDDFVLPPAALHDNSAFSNTSAGAEAAGGDAAEPSSGSTKRKRRSIAMSGTANQSPPHAASGDSTFTLPPPPSRSRKIIQVQPEDAKGSSSKPTGQGRRKSEAGKAAGASGAGASKPTAASRKTARKTAHSIIERRRRSKMNEEFETLKELVPAARGQNMHKLAILQAGIEYVRYLEDCIQGLQDAQSVQSSVKSTPYQKPADMRPVSSESQEADDMDEDEDDDDDDDDDDMDDEEDEEKRVATTPRASRPASGYQSRSSVSNTSSPAIAPMHQHTSSSSYALSTGSPSPAILPAYNPGFTSTAASSTLPSPALLPHDSRGSFSSHSLSQATPTTSSVEYHALQAHAKQALASHGEADQEVIATLAMMGTERRRSQEEKDRTDGTRGMSVRDLLSG